MGNLVFQATLGGQVNLVGPNTSSTYNINVPAVAGTMVVTGTSPTFTQVTSPTIGAASSASLSLQSNGTTNATLDTSGNLGLGVTPSAWYATTTKAIDVGAGGAFWSFSSNCYVSGNAYYNTSGNYIYKASNAATNYAQASGQHQWFNAPSGTAGNAITFTQAMTLDASGRLGVARTSPGAQFDVLGAASTTALRAVGNGNAALYVDLSGGGDNYYDATNHNFRSASGSTTYGKFDSSGNLLVGTTSTDSGAKMRVSYGSGSNGIGIQDTNNTNNTAFLIFQNSTPSNIGSVSRVGTTNAVIYNTTSDYRLKTVIGPVSGYKERINALEPIEFEWKEDGTRTRGFLAHKFQESYAHSVTGEKDAVDSDGNPVYQAMQAGTSEVIADLVALLKEQQAIIETLTNRITALEAK